MITTIFLYTDRFSGPGARSHIYNIHTTYIANYVALGRPIQKYKFSMWNIVTASVRLLVRFVGSMRAVVAYG